MLDFSAALNPDGLSLIEKARRGLLDSSTLTLEEIALLVVESEDQGGERQKAYEDLLHAVKQGRLIAIIEEYESQGTPWYGIGGSPTRLGAGPSIRYHVHRTRLTELLGPSLDKMSGAIKGWLRYVPPDADKGDEIKKEALLKRYEGRIIDLKGNVTKLDTWFRNHGPQVKPAQTRTGHYSESMLLALLRQSGHTVADDQVKPVLTLARSNGKQ